MDQTAKRLRGSDGQLVEAQIQAQVCALCKEVCVCVRERERERGRWVQGLAFEWLPGTLANYPPSFSSSSPPPGFLRRSHARKQSADGSERGRLQRDFGVHRKRKKKNSGFIYKSFKRSSLGLIKTVFDRNHFTSLQAARGPRGYGGDKESAGCGMHVWHSACESGRHQG